MKYLFLSWVIFYTSLLQAAPSTSVKGEASSASFTQNLVLPNYGVTKQAGINSRIETGNKNLLNNPSFEHSTIATGWTVTGGGTPASSTTNLQEGVKSVTTTSTGAWTFFQDSTLYAAGKSGQEAEASIWAYSATASADLWLCPRVNGASVTASVANGCMQYTNLGLPQKLTVYPLYGSTSTGIEIKGSGAITYILDDAYLGDRRPSVPGVTTTPWTLYTATITNLGTSPTQACYYKRIASDAFIRCNITPAATVGASPATVSLPTTPVSLTSYSNTTLFGGTAYLGAVGANQNTVIISGNTNAAITFGVQSAGAAGLTPLAASSMFTAGTQFSFTSGPIPITEWQGDNNSNTTRCDDPRNCETNFSAQVSTTSGVVTNQMAGTTFNWITSCTAANSTVCTFASNVFTVAPNCTAAVTTVGASAIVQISAVSSTSISIGSFTPTNGAPAASVPFTLSCQKAGADYTNSRITQQIIQGRTQVTSAGIASPKIFSANVTTTAGTLASNMGGVFTSCTAANPSVCTLTNLTVAPNCTATPVSGLNSSAVFNVASTSTSVSIMTLTPSSGALLASVPVSVFCQGY